MPTTSTPAIREATLADAAAIAEIYSGYIATTVASFETEEVGAEEMARRMTELKESGHPWLVAEVGGRVVGFAYATQFRPRVAYRRTAEVTIYLKPTATGRGIGASLYGALLPQVRVLGFHSAVAAIALPNDASVGLHESLGFRQVGCLAEVGDKFGRWIDVGYWQLPLE